MLHKVLATGQAEMKPVLSSSGGHERFRES